MSTTPINAGPIVSRLSLPAAVMIVMINAMPNIETNGMAVSSHLALPLNNLLKTSPAPMGMMIIFIISHIIFNTSTSTNAPASNFISSGVTKGASNVVVAVTVMDKARFAFARYDITLEARPLGEHPIKTMPAAISGGKSVNDANVNPISGIMINWLITPMTTPFGVLITPAKSFTLIEVPIPNMINCIKGMIRPLNLNPLHSKKYSG